MIDDTLPQDNIEEPITVIGSLGRFELCDRVLPVEIDLANVPYKFTTPAEFRTGFAAYAKKYLPNDDLILHDGRVLRELQIRVAGMVAIQGVFLPLMPSRPCFELDRTQHQLVMKTVTSEANPLLHDLVVQMDFTATAKCMIPRYEPGSIDLDAWRDYLQELYMGQLTDVSSDNCRPETVIIKEVTVDGSIAVREHSSRASLMEATLPVKAVFKLIDAAARGKVYNYTRLVAATPEETKSDYVQVPEIDWKSVDDRLRGSDFIQPEDKDGLHAAFASCRLDLMDADYRNQGVLVLSGAGGADYYPKAQFYDGGVSFDLVKIIRGNNRRAGDWSILKYFKEPQGSLEGLSIYEYIAQHGASEKLNNLARAYGH